MQQYELTGYKTRRGEADIIERVGLSIFQDEDGEIVLKLTRIEWQKRGTRDRAKEREEEFYIRFPDVEQLIKMTEQIDDWLNSKSKPRLSRDIQPVQGEHKITYHGGYRLRSRGPYTETENHSSFTLSIDDTHLHLMTETEDHTGFKIPAAETYKDDIPQDSENIETLDKFLYDFFVIDYDGEPPSVFDDNQDDFNKSSIDKIELIFDRFEKVAGQLKERNRDKPTLEIQDEYDVQYLHHSLLRVYFEDIRDETYLKQHAGVNPRIDFLIEEERIGIETKIANHNHGKKRIRNELAEDKEQYKSDEMCDTLLCFIYDPDKVLSNPAEIEKDLSEMHPGLETRVTITPD
ncbi:MAG: hypothetical protein U5J64_09260 [Halobacteriales archaeon]|nr:hypothetical protein [Halobacteriales archaeon]